MSFRLRFHSVPFMIEWHSPGREAWASIVRKQLGWDPQARSTSIMMRLGVELLRDSFGYLGMVIVQRDAKSLQNGLYLRIQFVQLRKDFVLAFFKGTQ